MPLKRGQNFWPVFSQKFWLEIKFWPADESTLQNRERPNRCQNSGNILIEATLMYGKQL